MIDPFQAIQDRHGKATKGPWTVFRMMSCDVVYSDSDARVCRLYRSAVNPNHQGDADFIAHAWEDIRTLLAEREALIAALREVERHCPCGARPESPRTHPHVTGCPVGAALAAQPLPDETRKA